MKKYASNEITFKQSVLLIFGIQVSVGFLALPRALAEEAGTDGWISLILGWIVAVTAGLIIVQVLKRCPDGTILELLTTYIGKWAGIAGAVLLALYFLYITYTTIVYSVLIAKSWLLPQTPAPVIMLLLLIPAGLIARKGLRIIARYSEIVVLLSLWIPFAYLFPLKDAHWLHLLPVLKEGLKPVILAVPTTFYFFVGFASTFIFYPFLQDKQKASLGIILSNTLTLLVFLFITIVCFVYFSPDRIADYSEPAINVLKTIEFKFIERIEVLFIAFYLFIFSLAWIPFMYFSVFCTSWLFGKKDHRGHLLMLWLLVAVGSFFFIPTSSQSEKMTVFLGKTGFYMEYVFPVLLLLYVWLYDRLKRGKSI
ncbi:GerAB/ArcD/ProY family transporter [Paenibacillus eucommiae]|uniref:Spore germination protein (Amino acid permease) n=1 Tax=Paenibacillus eucommiae TaxID=1355755 RepID=A0ABS4J5N3_9BACL|nr:endospore germination permease [Paenibacillus eucommiae]MBP1995138.1 spore germination protein (amino acid permease) [Paenibacillus eucommiae]